MTHSFLLEGAGPPECERCQVQLTIEHILVDCAMFCGERSLYHLDGKSVDVLLGEDSDVENIMNFLRDTGFYFKL